MEKLGAMSLLHHAFAGQPLRFNSNHASNKTLNDVNFDCKVLVLKKGRALVHHVEIDERWMVAWFPSSESEMKNLDIDSFVYLGSTNDLAYWAVDIGDVDLCVGRNGLCFVELRTLMVATHWKDKIQMEQLAIAGYARALLEWHGNSRFCGHCGANSQSIDAGRRKQCTKETCKKKIYPRIDPVVIMLVIDKENDRALLSRQSRFVPRMWSCLAGFIEPGETFEEAVRRETWEETGIEVGEVVYHSSQPWPVGPSSMPCQLMVGFFAYAKSFDIHVDKKELEDAQWHSREDVKKALTFVEYIKAQRSAASKINQMCNGAERAVGQESFASDFNVGSEELAPMFIPGPFAIAHHLISSWMLNEEGAAMRSKQCNSLSNL